MIANWRTNGILATGSVAKQKWICTECQKEGTTCRIVRGLSFTPTTCDDSDSGRTICRSQSS